MLATIIGFIILISLFGWLWLKLEATRRDADAAIEAIAMHLAVDHNYFDLPTRPDIKP